uniref:NADH-ubiquinone oxidoreductase chain 2 n=1 Tax=Aneurus sublobatus TaxID=1176473 RepID=A0A172DYT9_9HEMI|nr:NADH dehydrogenase subunit 2 [Aneurus sublobatus]AFI54682.1 NADH dehydrogenase subunit 2 [Aneurus sublobatus]
MIFNKPFMWIMLTGSSMISVSSSSWFGIWIGLEINLIAFIPMMKSKSKESSNSMLTYFLPQSLGSMILLFTVLISSINMFPPNMMSDLINIVMTISILIKLGLPPFHLWLPKMMNSMNWESCMWLMTWQKVAPLTAMFQLTEKSSITSMIAIMSTIMGSLGGINQTSMRTMMGYSSITHTGWMLMMSKLSYNWMLYLLIYSTITLLIMNQFKKMNIMFMNQILSLKKSDSIIILSSILSMGGLPPFIGFIPKWMVIQNSINSNEMMTITMMSIMSLMTLFFYLKMISPIILMSNSSLKTMNYKLSMWPMLLSSMTLPALIVLM